MVITGWYGQAILLMFTLIINLLMAISGDQHTILNDGTTFKTVSESGSMISMKQLITISFGYHLNVHVKLTERLAICDDPIVHLSLDMRHVLVLCTSVSYPV
jgi:hypothetical protein